jgi:hypothetical protein
MAGGAAARPGMGGKRLVELSQVLLGALQWVFAQDEACFMKYQ